MAQNVSDVMTTDLVTVPSTASIADVARLMRDRNIGDVLVTNNGKLRGIVTDRDIVVRGVAEGADFSSEPLSRVLSEDLTTVTPDTPIDRAAQIMGDNALRRLPVVDNGKPVGIVSIGDLAVERDPNSALGQISAQRPNN
jgi:CBS domain-containing protein